MKDDILSDVVSDLPTIKFSGRSAVKELAVTVHAAVDKENRVLEFLNQKIKALIQEENNGEKENK